MKNRMDIIAAIEKELDYEINEALELIRFQNNETSCY